MKILFLDVDGVLNRLGSPEQGRTKDRVDGFIGLEEELVDRLKKLLKETNAKVVLSSTWRLYPKMKERLTKAGIEWIGCTPDMSGQDRGKEVAMWLAEHNVEYNVEGYAIVDDDSDFLPGQPFFHTSFIHGLTEEIAKEIQDHLNSC